MGVSLPFFAKLRVGAGAFLALAVMMLVGEGSLIPCALIAALFHELGHYAAVRLCGAEIRSVFVGFTGATMEYYGGTVGYGGEVAIALAGPVASLALAVIASFIGREFALEVATELAGLSFVLCVFNLVPIRALDGGRALGAALSRFFPIAAARVMLVLSAILTLTLLAVGAYLALTAFNVTLLGTAVVLALMVIRER
ncbi:MAG: hypothetical protein LBN30_06430 [Oscillospiraceae bacterium]|jgi:stage IV sporulation protein FB|nr:hypothetical protein [Oscillospiraceae bacterium]